MPTNNIEMFITKATHDEKTGEYRWSAVVSDTQRDLYRTRMSIGLYNDFIRRIKANEPAPAPFSSRTWKGGMPYVSVSHYLDLEGKGVVGPNTDVYVEGDLLKAKGLFNDTPLGRAAFNAVRADIKNNTPQDGRVRMSIAFVDWKHTHGDMTFTRRTVDEVCPICDAGTSVDVFLEGQLVHEALTRVPANTRTSITLEERTMTTKKQDAASIVGEELAEELDQASQLVGRSEAEATPPALVVKSDSDATTDSDPVAPTTIAEVVGDPWLSLEKVLAGIASTDGRKLDRAAALKQALDDFRQTFNLPQHRSTLEEPKMTHPLDPAFEALRTAYDTALVDKTGTRATKMATVQTPLNELGNLLQRSIAEATPAAPVDSEALNTRLANIEQVLAQLSTALAQPAPVQAPVATPNASTTPAPRQIQLPAQTTRTAPAPIAPPPAITNTPLIEAIVRRTVMGSRA